MSDPIEVADPPEEPQEEAPAPPPRRPAMVGPQGTRHKREPTLGFLFSVEFTKFGLVDFVIPVKGYFTELSGLSIEYEVVEYKTTNLLGIPRRNQMPGRPTYSPITLRRGVYDSPTFWAWHEALILGMKGFLTADVILTIYDRSYKELTTFSIERAWPSKVSGVEVRADSNDVLVEEMVLQHGGIRRSFFKPELAWLDAIIRTAL